MGRKYQALRREQASLVKKLLYRDKVKGKSRSSPCASASNEPQQSTYAFSGSQEEAKVGAKARYRQAGQQMKALQHQQTYKSRQVQVKKLQQILHANRKHGHKIIFGGDSPAQRLSSVLDKSRTIVSDKANVKRTVLEYFADLMQYLETTSDDENALPWQEKGKQQLDPFDLQQGRNGPATCQDEQNMLMQMDDACIFTDLLDHLAKGKAAGLDGVPNEPLQALPNRLKEAINRLFVVMWLVGHTPDAWKTSRTVPLYKKGNPQRLQNWRPIALANTLYKTWTSMVTHVLSTYGERQGIIGSAQEGFHNHRNTMRQLQMAILMIEDAALYHQDLYSLYIDFPSAFNTVNHAKLLTIMQKLGFPDIAMITVKDIYTNATTTISMPAGDTADIPIHKGTTISGSGGVVVACRKTGPGGEFPENRRCTTTSGGAF